MRKLLKRIYPAHDELAVYVMALGILSLALFDHEFGVLLVTGARVVIIEATNEAFQSSWFEGLRQLFAALVLSVMALASLTVSLYLPFTSRRFDLLVRFVVMAHLIIVCVANFVAAQEDDTGISAIIALCFFVWMIGYFACLRYGAIHDVVAHRQASRKEGVFAGALAIGAILVCALFLKWHWAHSYAFVAVWAISITQVLVKEKEAPAGQVVQPSAVEKH